MRTLVVGSGAREHALCLALAADPAVTALACAPGNAGTAMVAEQYPVDATDTAAVVELAERFGADLVVIGPIFDTPSKRAYGPPLGVEVLGRLPLLSDHSAEVYAIGGMDEAVLPQLEPYRERITGIAGIRIFQEAADAGAVLERLASR